MITRFRRYLCFLAPEGGGGEGGAGGAPAAGGTGSEGDTGGEPGIEGGAGAEPPTDPPRPKYFDQMSKEKAEDEKYKAIYKYQKIDDLAEAVVTLSEENEKHKADAARSFVVPDAKDEKGKAEFYKKLGVPDTPEGYELPALEDERVNLSPENLLEIKKDMRNALLTPRQATMIAKSIVNISKMSLENTLKAIETRNNNFDANLTASYTEINSELDRKAAAERDKGAFDAFMAESGLADLAKKTGIAYNPEFVKGVANYARVHSGQRQPSSTPGTPVKNTAGSRYGSQFNNQYGRR